MHRRPPRWASVQVARCAALLGRHPLALLVLALTLLAASGSLLAAPRLFPAAAAAPGPTAVALEAATHQAGTAPRHSGGDHRRAEPPARQRAGHQAGQQPNPNCTLVLPAAPTSAGGLATPYRLEATDRAAGPCDETDADQSAFAEAAVYDPTAHEVSIYHPLVVDAGARPAAPPVVPRLPAGAVVAVWFGFNGDTLTLAGPGAASCVNGLPGSPFGQFAYCGAPDFFAAANGDPVLQAAIPALGTAADGRPCPSTRDFAVVDQDQSDNLATAYRVVGGRVGQLTAATAGGTPLTNGSDEGLLAKFVDPALGCRPWKARDLTYPGQLTAALALNELSAARGQAAPALVPTSDPMVQVDGRPSARKTDLYRAGVDQPPLPQGQTPRQYCARIAATAADRLRTDAGALQSSPSPSTAKPDLLTFLTDRLATSLQELGCAPAPADAADPAGPTG